MMKTRFFRRSQKEEPGGANATASGGMLTSSERSAMLTDSERSAGLGGGAVEIDIDFSVTESGRTVAHLVTGAAAAAAKEDDDDMNFSITSSGRTIERIMQDHQQASNNNSNPSATVGVPAAKATTSTPLVPAVTATISNPLTILPAKSPSRPIPKPQQQQQHRGSEDSSGSAFLSGILNPSPNNNNNNSNQLSHTPPTALGTSYENRHFGKRQRSGSVSGRLRSASDLEEKGLIDRQQKGILKDLIICGDEELQHALDQYEEGNPAVLENMIRSGALQNKAVPDLDLLGDLDLDFLTVNDMGGGELATEPEHREGPGMYTLPAAHGAHPNNQQQRAASMPSMPSYSATAAAAKKRQASDVVHTHRGTENFHDDGIGELEFTGEFGSGSGYYGATTTTNDTTAPPQHAPGQPQYAINPHSSNNDKSRTLSFGISADDARLRSNSLFSALINDPKSNTSENHQELGRWMDRVPINDHNTTATAVATDGRAHTTTTPHHSVSKPIPIPDNKPQATMVTRAQQQQPTAATTTTTTTPKKKGRRKSDSAAMNRTLKAKMKQELAEQKRREKQEKREKKEREKQEKREARLAAKEEKKKLKERKKEAAMEEDEKPVHVPGSGRPRSMSDPNFKTTRDEFGLVEIERPDGWVGAYSPESRKVRIEKFLAKRHQRVWTKTVKYDVRKNFADSRLRVKGRFVKKEDEMLMRDLMSMT